MSRFAIDIDDNQTTAQHRANVGPNAYAVRFSTVHPGGCAELSWRESADPTGAVVIPQHLGFNYRVDLRDGGEVIWSGRIEDMHFHHGTGGRYWQVVAKGYGVNLADEFEQTRNVANTETSTIVSNAISNLTGQIGATSITATGFTISNTTAVNLTMMNASLQIAWALRFGNSSFLPMVFYVYPDVDGTIRATLAARPTTPDVYAYLSDFENAEFGLQGRQLYNRITVFYNSGASVATFDNTDFQVAGPAGWNVTKEHVSYIPEITQSADAVQAAIALAVNLGSARVAATSLTVPSGERMPVFLNTELQQVRPWRIRAGTLFRFRDVDAAKGAAGNQSFLNEFLIDETEYDEDSHTLTIRPESYDNLIESSLAQVRALLGGKVSL